MQELYKKSSRALLRAKKRMKSDDDPAFLEGARGATLDFMYSAWQDQKCCDLIIKVTGGDIHAHTVAFGAYSKTLTNAFYGYTNGEIINFDLSDVRREVVLTIIHFLYTTELELSCHIIGQVVSCATKLGMDIIVHMCMDYLRRVSVDNAVLHYSIAENNSLKELRDNILRFLLENFSSVSSSKHFVYLPFNRLIAILKNENLRVNDEVDVLRAVIRWVDHKRYSRIEHSTELLQCVRFPLMPAEVLASEVETSDWIFVNKELWRDCLYKAMKYNALNGSEGNPGQPSPHSLASVSSKSQDGRRLGGMESNGEKMAGDSSGVRGKGFESIDQYQGQEMMRSDLSANSSGHQGSSSPQLGQPRTSQMGQAWSSHQIQQQRSSGDLTSRSTQQLQPRASQQQPAQLPQRQRSAHQLAQQRQSTNQMLHQRQSLHQLQQANVSQHSTQQMQEMQMRQCSKQINSEVQRKSNHQFQQSPQSQSHQSLTSQQNSLNSQLQQKSQISQQLSLQAQQSERMTSQVGLLNQGQSPRSQVSSGILSPNYSALRPSSSRQSSGQGQRNSTMSLPLDAKTSARSYQQFLASVPGSAKADLLANNASANAASSMQRLTSQDSFLMSEESMLCSPQYMHYNECDKGFLGESLTGDMDGLMMYRPDDKNFLDDDDPEVVYETNVDNQSCLCDYADGAQLGMGPSYQEQITRGFPGKLQASQTYIGNDMLIKGLTEVAQESESAFGKKTNLSNSLSAGKLVGDQLVVVGVGGIEVHSESLDVPEKIACVYEAGPGGKDDLNINNGNNGGNESASDPDYLQAQNTEATNQEKVNRSPDERRMDYLKAIVIPALWRHPKAPYIREVSVTKPEEFDVDLMHIMKKLNKDKYSISSDAVNELNSLFSQCEKSKNPNIKAAGKELSEQFNDKIRGLDKKVIEREQDSDASAANIRVDAQDTLSAPSLVMEEQNIPKVDSKKDSVASTWTCVQCTFTNDEDIANCAMCEAPRDFIDLLKAELDGCHGLITDLQNLHKTNNVLSCPNNWTDSVGLTKEEFSVIALSTTDADYKMVMDKAGPQFFDLGFKIKGIRRIQNWEIYKLYAQKKVLMAEKMGSDTSYEKWLFHGTSADCVDKISRFGFNRSHCGKNGTVLGKGVYFSRSSATSFRYTSPDHTGTRRMLFCSVLTGYYVPGSPTYIEPPRRTSTSLYDSVVDNQANPINFVVFTDYQAYPHFEISFKF